MSSEIRKLIKDGENENVEFKTRRVHLETIAKSICAMLNSQGGVILIGVSDDGEIAGIDAPDDSMAEIIDHIADQLSPVPLLSVSSHTVARKEILMIDVPQGADKPYSLGREIFVRVGKRTLKADTDDTATIVGNAAAKLVRWEAEPMPGFGVEDCDEFELSKAKTEIVSSGRMGSRDLDDNLDFLGRLRLTQRGQLTNGAAVLFASDSLSWSPNLAIRIVSFTSEKSADIANDTMFSGPAVSSFHDTLTKIQQLTGYSGRFGDDDVERKDVPAYSAYALREGLVNAIVHRDYTLIGGKIHVEIYPNHLTIRNPGRLPDGWKVADLKKKHGSVPFNPDIARVFYLRRLMEQLGIGTQKVVDECKKIGADPPQWTDAQGMVTLTLYSAPEPNRSFDLNSRQQTFLKKQKPGSSFKAGYYAHLMGVVNRQARRELNELIEFGFVERSGRGPATIYIRTNREL